MDNNNDSEQEEKRGYGRPPKEFWFKKGQSGNPKGRPKNRVKDQLDETCLKAAKEMLRPEEVKYCLDALLSMGFNSLKAVAASPYVPTLLKVYSIALLTDMKEGKCVTMDKLLDRRYGKAKQFIETDINKSELEVTEAELMAELERLRDAEKA